MTSNEEEEEQQQNLLITPNIPIVTTNTTTSTTTTTSLQPSSPPDHKRQRTTMTLNTPTTTTTVITPVSVPITTPIHEEEKKPSAFDDSRRLFQRLWTDEDEIGLLQGFLEYTSQRGGFKNSAYHHDTAPFYDQIKSKLQLDFNKNQLVEKLRRLKKKFRNVMSRINSGKDFNFKTPHDQATFEISRKIWSGIIDGITETGIIDDDDQGNTNPSPLLLHNSNTEINGTYFEKKASGSSSRSRKRSRNRAAVGSIATAAAATVAEENVSDPTNLLNCPVNSSIPSVIEETVRSCLSPLFKEFMFSAINGPGNSRGFGGMGLNLLPMNFGGNISMNLVGGEKEMMDDKWRKQQILELEVYSKRVDLVQDQIKLALEELRSKGSR
ncbi:mediator-associated protein [Thalictrum thalictroides]|uniref:Mediator-associated protein n=2 Tax=Thalictrum thalictroides TaxID=46969 RepID=A0A7J6XHN4_THATH|nr:mediator-associated protein [Thalictrum thalictroides]